VANAHAGALRRLAAAAYDGLLLFVLLMVLTGLAQLLTHGQAISTARNGVWAYLYRGLLALCVIGYFGIAWTRAGQTLGMKAWRLRLESAAGTLPSWRAVAARLAISAPLHLLAIAGLLLFIAHRASWPLLTACLAPLAAAYFVRRDGARRTIVDRLSGTRMAHVPAAPAPISARS